MTFDEARVAMREASTDLEALRPFLESGFDKEGTVTAAWMAARARFLDACKQYAANGVTP